MKIPYEEDSFVGKNEWRYTWVQAIRVDSRHRINLTLAIDYVGRLQILRSKWEEKSMVSNYGWSLKRLELKWIILVNTKPHV